MTIKNIFLISVSVLAVIVTMLIPAIPQDTQYHQFADQLPHFGIPHFFNVVSNIPYLLAGYTGFHFIAVNKQVALVNSIRVIYQVFFTSIFLIGLGSTYYHLSPDNSTLIWDRLPMAVAFMSFFIIILAEYINEKFAAVAAIPLFLFAVASVLYWYWSESTGQGDLRMYGLVQFLPVILIPFILSFYSARFTRSHFFWLMIGCYVLAKLFELMDHPVYQITHVISGHTLKHLISSVAPFMLYLALKGRSEA